MCAWDWSGKNESLSVDILASNPPTVENLNANVDVGNGVNITIDAWDAGGIENVEFWVDNELWDKDTTPGDQPGEGPNTYSYYLPIPKGGHTIKVRVFDSAGNVVERHTWVNTGLSLRITSPSQGATVCGKTEFEIKVESVEKIDRAGISIINLANGDPVVLEEAMRTPDLDGDKKISLYDVVRLTSIYGATPGDELRWNENVDLDYCLLYTSPSPRD